MATLGPHRPRTGWALRWIRQAAALCVAAPMAFLTLGVAVLVLGIVGLLIHRAVPGLGGTALASGLVALAVLPAAMVSNLLLAADGRGWRSVAELAGVVRPTLLPVFAVAGGQGLLAACAPGTAADLASLSELEAVMALGLSAYIGAVTVMAVLNVFWLGSCAALGLEPSDAWGLQEAISKREGAVFLTLLVVTLVAGQVLLLVHPALGLLALLAYQAWNYVAGREVLGGIDENGTPEGAADRGALTA
jgi:hypothetical protein